MRRLQAIARVFFLTILGPQIIWAADPLASWNEGGSKKTIVSFVAKVTTPGTPDFVPPAERIAVFDQDGTLCVEQPLGTQTAFTLDEVIDRAKGHPEWKNQEPFKAVLTCDREAAANVLQQDTGMIAALTHCGMTVDAFQGRVAGWLATARHPRFRRPYTELVYQPMLEVMRYLRANGFKTYIVTGSGQEFVRTYAGGVYGVVPEQVIGSAERTGFQYDKDGRPILVKRPEVLLIDVQEGKPEAIDLFIGRRPVAAFGNSTGDQQMLEWTQAGKGPRLMMLVYHDDATREYAYGAESKSGTFSKALMAEAKCRNWNVISMKNDWNTVFSWQKANTQTIRR